MYYVLYREDDSCVAATRWRPLGTIDKKRSNADYLFYFVTIYISQLSEFQGTVRTVRVRFSGISVHASNFGRISKLLTSLPGEIHKPHRPFLLPSEASRYVSTVKDIFHAHDCAVLTISKALSWMYQAVHRL